MSTRQEQGPVGQLAEAQAPPVRSVNEVTISLVAPVSRARLERWVDEQVGRLRRDAGSSGLRLGRLSAASEGQGADWLVEVDLRDREVPLEEDVALTSILVDLQLLGLRPQLLLPAHTR